MKTLTTEERKETYKEIGMRIIKLIIMITILWLVGEGLNAIASGNSIILG